MLPFLNISSYITMKLILLLLHYQVFRSGSICLTIEGEIKTEKPTSFPMLGMIPLFPDNRWMKQNVPNEAGIFSEEEKRVII
jgi:hypothetical protein